MVRGQLLCSQFNSIHCINSLNKSAGFALLLKHFQNKLETHRKDNQGHWIISLLKMKSSFLILCNVYGYNNAAQNKGLLSKLTSHLNELAQKYSTNNFILGGDVNMVYNEWLDRSPSKFQSHHINVVLLNFCLDLNLVDPWREANQHGQSFSWHKPDGSAKSGIDFWLISDGLMQSSVNAAISPAPLSDHCLIKLNINSIGKIL